MSDTIYRQEAIDAVQGIGRLATLPDNDAVVRMSAVEYVLFNLPAAQPEITDEQAIEHLQSTGWMQNHDREMYESGLREQLADDSGSYDSLLLSAHPELPIKEKCTVCPHCDNCDVNDDGTIAR